MSPANSGGISLPEDRSLWPSFLSGGLLPPPSTANGDALTPTVQEASTPSAFETHAPFRVSSSVPARASSALSMSRPTSAGPRLHDYAVPSSSVTHVRPGVFSVPTAPLPVPVSMDTYRERGLSVSSDRAGSPSPASYSHHPLGQSSYGAQSYAATAAARVCCECRCVEDAARGVSRRRRAQVSVVDIRM